ncbi:MAG: glycosyltransferase [Armatimonadetes bacterium]|nr:glycosyltransferase [Armatimonadota bacterium]
MATPVVSVITPAYKAARYIGQAIESVQAQTLKDWEMIIVDDASPDETVEVVKRYLDDPRIKLLQNEQNMGAGYTRNRALDTAQGEWIAVLDADDWYAPERLEKLVRFAREWDAQMVADLSVRLAEDGTVLGVRWSPNAPNPNKPRVYTAEEVIRAHPSFEPVIWRQFIEEKQIRYQVHIKKSQDYAFQTEILIKGARFALLPEPMYYYRIHNAGITATFRGQHLYTRMSCEYLCSLPETTPRLRRLLWYNQRRGELKRKYPYFASALKKGNWGEAWRILREDPQILKLFFQRLPLAIRRRLLGEQASARSLGED